PTRWRGDLLVRQSLADGPVPKSTNIAGSRAKRWRATSEHVPSQDRSSCTRRSPGPAGTYDERQPAAPGSGGSGGPRLPIDPPCAPKIPSGWAEAGAKKRPLTGCRKMASRIPRIAWADPRATQEPEGGGWEPSARIRAFRS